MSSGQGGPTRQLRFAAPKLLKLAGACVMLGSGAVLIPLNGSIAAGHTAGLWTTLLYEVGPGGRWAFAVACMGFFLFATLRLAMVAASDRIALRVDEDGIFVRTITRRRQVPWRDILTIDLSSTRVRRRTRRSVRVRIRSGDGETSLHVPLSLLHEDEDDVATWIAQARRSHADGKAAATARDAPTSSSGFGRRTTVATR